MSRTYTAYGLRIEADCELPGLQPVDRPRAIDVRISQSAWPESANPPSLVYESATDGSGTPRLRIVRDGDDGPFEFAYNDGVRFWVSADGSHVRCHCEPGATIEDAAIYLRGPIFGFVLRRRGLVCLHASAVAIDGRAIAIVGEPGAGKSTTAAALLERGCSILSDDLVALAWERNGPHVLPGCPRLHLWPDAGAAVYGDTTLPRLAPAGGVNGWWDKRYRDLRIGTEFCAEALPLAAIYVLGEWIDGPSPQFEPLPPSAAFLWLTRETSVNYALDSGLRSEEFEVLGRLVREIPVRLIALPDDRARLAQLTAALLDDVTGVAPGAAT